MIPNVHTTLRLVLLRWDARGNLQAQDLPILAWDLNGAPVPITLVDTADPTIAGRAIHDRETHGWITPDGRAHSEWRTVVGPIYDQREAPAPAPAPALTVPVIGAWPSTPRNKPPGSEGGVAPGKRN